MWRYCRGIAGRGDSAAVFAGGREPAKGYTADPDEIAAQVDGERYQIGLLLQCDAAACAGGVGGSMGK